MPVSCYSRLFLFLLAAAVAVSDAAASTIGLYIDENGSTCSFAGNETGQVTAHVVIKPDAAGVLSAQFSAPVPACLGAVHLYDQTYEGVSVFGNSQSGVSVVFPTCVIEGYPGLALTIVYFRSGSTDSCCEYPIVAAPLINAIEGIDCGSEPMLLGGITSHFNADTTCPCADAVPPLPPHTPSPWDGQTEVAVTTPLSWSANPLDPDIAEYDLYLGTAPAPTLVATVIEPQHQPPLALETLTQYYWRVVARDFDGLETSGPTWTFTTGAANYPPAPPTAVYPGSGGTNVPVNVSLRWYTTDVDGDSLSYDVHFGTEIDPPLVVSGLVEPVYSLPELAYATTYRWRVVVRDSAGNSVTGAVWYFMTGPGPDPLTTPFHEVWNVPFNQVNLTWQVEDPEFSPATFDVYLGTSGQAPLVATDLTTASYVVNLHVAEAHYWRVVAHDGHGNDLVGPLWIFGTRQNTPPSMLWRSPANGATVPPGAILSWSASDPDGDLILYNVFLGTGSTIPLVASGISANFFDPGPLQHRTWFWECRLWDVHGDGTRGFEMATGDRSFIVSSTATGVAGPPIELALGRNRPNPFNPETMIPYSVPYGRTGRVRLCIHDAAGRLVRVLVDEHQSGGEREVIWRGDDQRGTRVASGIYHGVLEAGGERRTQKLVLLK